MTTDAADTPVSLADVERARELLTPIVRTTPLQGARWLSTRLDGPAYLKCENLQRAGSFKIRGAYVRLARLDEQERARGVVAASAGNHAQGVALAAHLVGVRSTVFMPAGAPLPKEDATRAYGADIRVVGQVIDDALEAATEFAAQTGAVLIHPFDHADVVAGQGTVGLEILEQCPDVATILCAVGGGGLIGGLAAAVKAHRPQVRIVGVQAAGAATYPASLAAGAPLARTQMATMADGIAVGRPGDVPFELVRRHVDDVVTVSEEAMSKALLMVLERAKTLVEPAGGAAVAAALDTPELFEPPAVVVLSGGNVDPVLLSRVIRHGMAAAGRYLSMRVRIPDRPGGLARMLGELAAVDANVLDVVHERTSAALHLDEVDVAMQVETRGAGHRERILGRLHDAGYLVMF